MDWLVCRPTEVVVAGKGSLTSSEAVEMGILGSALPASRATSQVAGPADSNAGAGRPTEIVVTKVNDKVTKQYGTEIIGAQLLNTVFIWSYLQVGLDFAIFWTAHLAMAGVMLHLSKRSPITFSGYANRSAFPTKNISSNFAPLSKKELRRAVHPAPSFSFLATKNLLLNHALRRSLPC
jgi:hypothetical protein